MANRQTESADSAGGEEEAGRGYAPAAQASGGDDEAEAMQP